MASDIIKDFIMRGLRGVPLNNGDTLWETDVENLTNNIMSIMPSTDIRLDFLESEVLSKIPDRENGGDDNKWFILLLDRLITQIFNNLGNKNEAYHHIFLLSGIMLRQQGFKTDDLLHKMITYYEAYKIPQESLPNEINSIEVENAITIPINQTEYIRIADIPYYGKYTLIETLKQQQINIKTNGTNP